MVIYRFKTDKELTKEFGANWREILEVDWDDEAKMDHLLGKTLKDRDDIDAIKQLFGKKPIKRIRAKLTVAKKKWYYYKHMFVPIIRRAPKRAKLPKFSIKNLRR